MVKNEVGVQIDNE